MQNCVRGLVRGTVWYWASLGIIWPKFKAEFKSCYHLSDNEWNISKECAVFNRIDPPKILRPDFLSIYLD